MKIKRKIDLKSIVIKDRHVLNGAPCFKGSRVPVYIILDHISAGWQLDDLTGAFPTVKKEYISLLIKYCSERFFFNGKNKTRDYCF